MSRLVVVTASTNLERARPCVESWGEVEVITVVNGCADRVAESCVGRFTYLSTPEYLGTVEAFKTGVDYALEHTGAEIVACLHDDVILQDPDWVQKVIDRFDRQPAIGLLGFGGAIGLGAEHIYQVPYQPVQLARIGFRSNLVDAEVHGIRSLLPERVACLDGFSQIGRREFWEGLAHVRGAKDVYSYNTTRPWHVLADLGMTHHFYDSALGCITARYGWETWYLPIRCRHLGGQTAVGDQGYQAWAQSKVSGGDHGFWEQAHKAGYEAFKDVLPIRL